MICPILWRGGVVAGQVTTGKRNTTPFHFTRIANVDVSRFSGITLMLPDANGPHPAIVFIHGSGPGDRNELRFIADFFLVNGFATVVYGKRANWIAASFSDLALEHINPKLR